MAGKANIIKTIEKQREFFKKGATKGLGFRVQNLKILKRLVLENEKAILNALNVDLGRSDVESYIDDISFVIKEIDFTLKHIAKWIKPKKVKTPLFHFPGTSLIYPEPYGVVLIIGPWNAPFHLIINPLVGAIAAGNCAVLKPSEISVNTSKLVGKLIPKYFNPVFVSVVQGAVKEAQVLLSQKFDHIFFTGSPMIGKIVMKAAGEHLTPVTLELGGKNACIVDKDVKISTAAKRIVIGKFINAGQVCAAPDYLLVHQDVKEKLLKEIKQAIIQFFGDNPYHSPDFARIISKKHFQRISELLDEGDVIIGGDINKKDKYIAPTVITGIFWDSRIMQEEIFGPILPVIEYNDIDDVVEKINSRPKSLALYLFSNNKVLQDKIITETSSGGVCINDTIVHSATNYLPFGGVGKSGMGSYHGKASFDNLSHKKSVMRKSLLLDYKKRYPPYPKLTKSFKWLVEKLS